MHIAFAASECVPFSKTGGLADVIGALPPALAYLGHQVTVYLPLYKQTHLEKRRTVIPSITVPFDDRYRFCSVVDGGQRAGVQFYFIDYPPYFNRDGLYGTALGDYHDNAERFAMFSRAVLEATKVLGAPDVINCHDWQTALIPILLKTLYHEDPLFAAMPCVFTIHNLGYQGIFPPEILPLIMLPWDLFTIARMEFYGKVNFLKGAIVLADFVTTVSRRYSQEIQTAEYGFGLEGVLRARGGTLTGIVNGVDYGEWNPETDTYIAAHYSAEDLSGKAECKRDLLRAFGLATETKLPVIGMISRMVPQKGFDLVQQVADRMALQDLILVVLGSSGEPEYEEMFRRLTKLYPQKFAVKIAYDNALAHKIEAGSDMFLMPSHYEPCGMNQIYSLRYGTVPIVRAVGGLDDTVEQFDPKTRKGTGFKFREYSGEVLLETVTSALPLYGNTATWRALMRNGMAQDYSWPNAARDYLKAYERARQARPAAGP